MVIFSSVIILALGLFLFSKGPRPRLDISDIETSFPKNIALEDLLFEIKNSFEEISEKSIELYFDKKNKKTPIKRSPELTYGIRNFVGNAVKFSKKNVFIKS